MSGEVEKCPILHVRPKFDVFTLGVVCKLIFAFLPENIGVGAR